MALSKIDVANMLTGATPVANGGTAATTFAAAGLSKRPNAKPIIINGNMAVAQRGTSTTGVTNGNSGYITCDRMRFNESGTMGAALTITQESLTSGNAFLNGFANAYKVDVTTADGSPDADDWSRLNMRFEGQDVQMFKKGTANAEKFTLAFWVKATKTGTNTIELYDNDNNRSVNGSYTISTTNTWEHKVVNFPADTTGAFGDDNAESLRITWTLSAGSNYSSGTLASTWGSPTTANAAAGQVNNFDSTSNNFHITGIQLEVGEFSSTTLPPFQHESFGENLQRCLRYYYRNNGRSGFGAGTGFVQDGAVKAYIYHTMPVAPRTEMSFSLSGTSAAILSIDGNAGDDVQSIGGTFADSFPFKDYEFNFVTDGSSITDKAGMGIRINASNYIEGDAEL